MNDELREILEEFFTEADESLDDLEQDLIKLETISEGEEEKDGDLIDRIFRVMHTLKGGAGFLGLDEMARLAHAGENLLDEVRADRVNISKEVMDALLETNDLLKELLDISKADEDPKSVEIDPLINELEHLSSGDAAKVAAQVTESAKPAEPAAPEAPSEPVLEASSEGGDLVAETPNVETVEEPQASTVGASKEDAPDARPSAEPVGGDGSFADIPDLLINEDLLSAVKSDPLLDESRDVEAQAEKQESSENAAPSSDIPINAELLAEIQADDRLDEALDKDGEGQAEAKQEAPVVESTESLVNEELLAEIQADDRLDESLDKDGEAEVAAASETSAVEPAESLVNEELLAEIQADDRLDEALDKDGGEVDESTEQAPVAEVAAPPTPAQEQAVVKRGDEPVERRKVVKNDRRSESQDRRNKPRRAADAVDATIRVETSKLDKTMNLVGELVLARNSLMRQFSQPEIQARAKEVEGFDGILENMEHLSRVTKDLQMSVLSTRMQPIKKVFDKIPRQVRELKNKLNKELDLIIEGEMTEVDKSLVEELADPMVHLIRNSLDHGIETPADRTAQGKSPNGTLSVRAFYEGNKVVIEIADDGKGIDPETIKQVAIKKGVIDEYQASSLSDQDSVRLIMAPGFSTAEQISDVSGRGVGMDVVNSKIQAIKGNVDIQSEIGVGTTISIYLPLTLAIMQALIVQTGYEGFAVPIGDISEVIKFRPQDVHKVNEQDVIELRGEVLPLYYLHKLTKPGKPLYGVEKVEKEDGTLASEIVKQTPAPTAKEMENFAVKAGDLPENIDEVVVISGEELQKGKGRHVTTIEDVEDHGYVIVVKEGNSSMGVVTEKLIGQEEAVVKPITEMFDYNPAISGATISGDGIVHMILDIPFMIKEITSR